MKTRRVLILEDDLETLSLIMQGLRGLEDELSNAPAPSNIAVTVFSEYSMVEKAVNRVERVDYDLVLLDRDCKEGGSFHVLDFTRINPAHIIAISSVPAFNEEAAKRGVTHVVHKDYNRLPQFAETLMLEVRAVLS